MAKCRHAVIPHQPSGRTWSQLGGTRPCPLQCQEMQFQPSHSAAAALRGDQYGPDGIGAEGGERVPWGQGGMGGSCREPVILKLRKERVRASQESWDPVAKGAWTGLLTGKVCAWFKGTVTQQQPPVASSCPCPCPKLSSPCGNSLVCLLDSGARLPSLDPEPTIYLLCDVGNVSNFSVSVSTSEQCGIDFRPCFSESRGLQVGACGGLAAAAAAITTLPPLLLPV